VEAIHYELHAGIEDRHWWFAGRRRILRAVVERVCPPGAGRSIVDVGCGTGANLAALADGWRCRGLDASSDAVRLAGERFPGLEVVRAEDPLERADWLREADVVLLMDVIEHVEDDFELLSRVLGPLRAGAHVLITVPADPQLWSPHDESFGHWRRYEAQRLRLIWQGLPVTERLLSGMNARLLPVIRTVRGVRRRLGRAAGHANTDFRLPFAPINGALTDFFAGESARLLRALDGGRGYSDGASWIAVLRREPGELHPRSKPPGLPPDQHDPTR
jgi:2-polyprenyl-3-methyl-5-hydroxy-6-metoxy-1,4-benzoquinol methylase